MNLFKKIVKQTNKISARIVFVVGFAFSCNDDPEPSRTDLLTANAWKIDERISNGKFLTIEGCVFDSRWEYKRDNTMKLDAGETKCNPEESQVQNGTWKFVDNEKGMEVEVSGALLEYEIIELKAGVLRVRNEYNIELKYEDVNN